MSITSITRSLFYVISWDLPGKTDLELDNTMISRIREVTKLSDKDKEHILITLDALIRDFKNKQAFGI